MDHIFQGYRRILVVLCIGAFVLACGQGQPRSAAFTAIPTEVATASIPTTAQPTATYVPTALAAAPQAELTRTINLRRGPGTSYPIIRAVARKTVVELLAVREENGERWYRVRVGSDEGWMSATVLPVDDAVAAGLPFDIQAIAPPPTPKPVAARPTAKPQPPVAPAIVAPSTGVRVGAICRDGTRSSATGRGACSHHGGVDHWLVR